MKYSIKKIYNILIIFGILLSSLGVFAKEINIQYTHKNISNYFSGIISANQNYNNKALKYLKKVKPLKSIHSNFNIEFLRTLVLLEKFDEAFAFSKTLKNENEIFFDVDLLLGLNYFLEKDYEKAEKHFGNLNAISIHNQYFSDFIGNVLIAWSKASQGNEKESSNYLEKIPKPYQHLKKIQNIFLQCYFDNFQTQKALEELIDDESYNFSRYNFFLVNYLLVNNKVTEAKNLMKKTKVKHSPNILIKQTKAFLLNNDNKKIKIIFDCKNPKDTLAEFFYVIGNLYASQENYKLSNFYMKISLFLNNKFKANNALLAENYLNQKKNDLSIDTYQSLKSIGSEYSWYASKQISRILINLKGKKSSIDSLKKEFNSIKNKNYEHYYELANFYKDNEYFEESIKYYTLALDEIEQDHLLVPKILDRRGTSFERINDWESGEKDLIKSLEILPDQARVINYLAYTWVDKGTNVEKGLEMLKRAVKLSKNDGYIIDSLGWAHFMKKNYDEAEFYLQRAVELLPSDPIINDHYADALWMLNKNLQARYIWSYIANLDHAEQKLKDTIKKKLIFGINKEL
jgi:tetratricopeptide (TPR) repeat protein